MATARDHLSNLADTSVVMMRLVFDRSTPTASINAAETHFKSALDTRRQGLNRN